MKLYSINRKQEKNKTEIFQLKVKTFENFYENLKFVVMVSRKLLRESYK